jgi:hypothetical protein
MVFSCDRMAFAFSGQSSPRMATPNRISTQP